jgi:hypothetical protein
MKRTSGIDDTTVASHRWDESKYNREPKGSEEGGQFASKEGAGAGGLAGDEKKWFDITPKEKSKIAKQWAKKYTMRQLRAFQSSYTGYLKTLQGDAWKAMDNRWQTVTEAIDWKAFGK